MHRLQRATGDRHLFLLFILLSDDPGEKGDEGKKKNTEIVLEERECRVLSFRLFCYIILPPTIPTSFLYISFLHILGWELGGLVNRRDDIYRYLE